MEVILLQDVEKLGLRGEVVDVARGYARNYLLPRRLAENATPARVAELRKVDDARAKHEARTAEQAQEIAAVLGKTVLTFDVKSGPTGALFGSVTTTDIADEIWRTRKIRVDRKKIATDSLKRIGRYSIAIQVFEGVTVEVKTLVVPEGGDPRAVLDDWLDAGAAAGVDQLRLSSFYGDMDCLFWPGSTTTPDFARPAPVTDPPYPVRPNRPAAPRRSRSSPAPRARPPSGRPRPVPAGP